MQKLASLKSKSKAFWQALGLIWAVSPVQVILLGTILLIQGIIPATSIWLTKSIVDALSNLSQNSGPEALWSLIIIWIASLFINSAINPWTVLIEGNLAEKLIANINLILIKKASQLPDLSTFEDSKFYDTIQILQEQAGYRPLNLIFSIVSIIKDSITLFSVIILLFSMQWWLPIVILLSNYPQIYLTSLMQRLSWEGTLITTAQSRQMRYLSSTVLNHNYAKELKLFDFHSLINDKYQSAFKSLHQLMRSIRLKQAIWPSLASLLSITGNAIVFVWVITSAIGRLISIGSILLIVQSLNQIQQKLNDISEYTSWFLNHLLFFEKLFDFLRWKPRIFLPEQATHLSLPIKQGITFEKVDFSYPDGHVVLSNVSFTIEVGQKVAIVGENGAGKSTLIKLLCRFYDPGMGRILVDGIDIKNLDLKQWRSLISAVFQDFGQYQLTVKENIMISNVKDVDENRIIAAMDKADISSYINQLPDGLENMLGKQFDGADLSGGQWQKLAIARAFYRQAEILILDEPTAALDPRSEHLLYEQFAQLAEGKTAILITHRLASVQMADKILVIQNGSVIEEGVHHELMEKNGEYANLFKMQADRYQFDDKN